MSKSSIAKKAAGVVAAAAAVPALITATAHADTAGTVYFSVRGLNCSIADDGTVGCDSASSIQMQISLGGVALPFLIPVNQVVIDVPWAPAHPGFGGAPHTLPGGNPAISAVGHPSGSGPTSGYEVTHAGASCSTGFHGSFGCKSKGHAFSYYEVITAN
ncbi:hypothetical protein [Rhodococcus opacus]|uniref:hypothetical protein n=1 Tax=Rhodococcus opacus TaxID=37919 RepID=UPI00294902A9|nr:hypothetical protein [Rhodococcus opacus]MDV6247063.1 hypothetical protein [Rhodococcus opacus]